MSTRSVILLSGGLDSAANLALGAKRCQIVLALTADYGQRAAAREKEAAVKLAEIYDVPHQTLDLRWLGALGGSALTDTKLEMPVLPRSLLDNQAESESTAKRVWVPNRNGVLINVAAAYAERLGANRVLVGFNREEAATFPDNSQAFLDRATGALSYSTANGVQVHCYTTAMDKREIVAALRAECPEFPFAHLWSCYHGGATPCGACESCERLARAQL